MDSIRSVRFQTDSVISANAGVLPIFRQKQTRVLPGAPKAVDRLREAVLRNDYKLGFLGLRKALYESKRGDTTDDVLQATKLSEGLRRSGATIGEGDLTKVNTSCRAYAVVHRLVAIMRIFCSPPPRIEILYMTFMRKSYQLVERLDFCVRPTSFARGLLPT